MNHSTAREGTQQLDERLPISGTLAMVLGTASIAASAFVFQVISGRVLGADAFTPVGVTWTVVFFSYTVLMIPAEQLITRYLTLSGGSWHRSDSPIAPVATALGLAIVGSTGFTAATLDRFFEGDRGFVFAIAAVVSSRGILALGRGFLAGRRRFVGYGLATGMEGLLLLPGSLLVASFSGGALAFVWTMAIAPLSVLLLRPFAESATRDPLSTADSGGASFLGALVMATGASQIVLAGGPIVVGLIGGTASAVSIYFVTFTLFRGPVTSSYNLIARVLPDFTALAASGEDHQLRVWARRLATAGVVASVLFGLGGYLLGPRLVKVLYGGEFAPSAHAAALGAAAVGAALVGLFVGQLYVARGEVHQMAAMWVVALVAAGASLAIARTEPVERVATAFLVGELTATLLLASWAIARHHPGHPVDQATQIGKRST